MVAAAVKRRRPLDFQLGFLAKAHPGSIVLLGNNAPARKFTGQSKRFETMFSEARTLPGTLLKLCSGF
jgi:hypothetical protein